MKPNLRWLLVAGFVASGCHAPTSPAAEPLTDSTPATSVQPAPAATLTVSGQFPAPGGRAPLAAIYRQNGNVQDVTNDATWTTSTPSVVTVSSNGIVMVKGWGYADVEASYQGLHADLAVFLAR